MQSWSGGYNANIWSIWQSDIGAIQPFFLLLLIINEFFLSSYCEIVSKMYTTKSWSNKYVIFLLSPSYVLWFYALEWQLRWKKKKNATTLNSFSFNLPKTKWNTIKFKQYTKEVGRTYKQIWLGRRLQFLQQ